MSEVKNVDAEGRVEPIVSSDPREYVASGGRRCAMKKSEWVDDWWVSHSPRNNNYNAEGPWEDWVDLAKEILAADEEWKANAALRDASGIIGESAGLPGYAAGGNGERK